MELIENVFIIWLLSMGLAVTTLIVFFVVAANVGSIARRAREMNDRQIQIESYISDMRYKFEKLYSLMERESKIKDNR